MRFLAGWTGLRSAAVKVSKVWIVERVTAVNWAPGAAPPGAG